MTFPWKAHVHLKGITPLIIHNSRAASPLDIYSKKMKAITSKRKKTEEDYRNLLQIQWESALYWDAELGVHFPVENVIAALLKAAKKHKMGPQISGFIFDEPIGFPIITENSKDWQKLVEDSNNKFVKLVTIQRSKTLSCRPIFHKWEFKFNFNIDEELITIDDTKLIIATMSQRIGLGVWTASSPKPGNYGRFMIKEIVMENLITKERKVYENENI